jgi:CDGSH-type Zn-finger protein
MSSTNKQLSVTVSKDGPYIVSGEARLTEQVIVTNAEGDSLQWREGEVYEAAAKFALCRCGHSDQAPFWDVLMPRSALTVLKRPRVRPIRRR